MTLVADIARRRFGRLRPLRLVGSTVSRHALWECKCRCGNLTVVTRPNLISGATQSCGCLAQEKRKAVNTTHGETVGCSRSPEYGIWSGIVKRCENNNTKSWHRYGGRGVRICRRWRKSFPAFLKDMGRRPSPAHSIDRFPNPDGDYRPGNCRWATSIQQGRNRSGQRMYEFRGHTGVASELAEIFGLKASVVQERLREGKSIGEALTCPPKKRRSDDQVSEERKIAAGAHVDPRTVRRYVAGCALPKLLAARIAVVLGRKRGTGV
jgi:hypothetical protein